MDKEELFKPLDEFLKANYPVSPETVEMCRLLIWRDCKYQELLEDIRKFATK